MISKTQTKKNEINDKMKAAFKIFAFFSFTVWHFSMESERPWIYPPKTFCDGFW